MGASLLVYRLRRQVGPTPPATVPRGFLLSLHPGFWKTCPENWPAGCYPYKVCVSLMAIRSVKLLSFVDVVCSCVVRHCIRPDGGIKNQNGRAIGTPVERILTLQKRRQWVCGERPTPPRVRNKQMYRNGAPPAPSPHL